MLLPYFQAIENGIVGATIRDSLWLFPFVEAFHLVALAVIGGAVLLVDFRLLAEATPGPGERIVTAAVDISALRHERETRVGHHMLAHLRTDAYPVYRESMYPPADRSAALSYEENQRRIARAKEEFATRSRSSGRPSRPLTTAG